jgi:hypothetical protein
MLNFYWHISIPLFNITAGHPRIARCILVYSLAIDEAVALRFQQAAIACTE